ncbi:MAG: hypothetical protein HRU71_06725 [Planctomycetia bacterium]|nr:MAG: hypothetical protein HRU71_06725 [Planctomycetia bacterium]
MAAMFAGALFVAVPSRAQETRSPEDSAATDARGGRAVSEADVMRPTELGLRFTPKMAQAMSRKFVEQMTKRYELDEKQAGEIEAIMVRQFMTFAHENEKTGRDLIELMFATMIEHDGRMPKEEAMEFARMSEPLSANLKKLFTNGAAEIGQQMSVTQRLKFTGDVTAAAAGLTIFETRMKRWRDGKVGDNANPFMDPPGVDPNDEKAEPPPEDPTEPKERRDARQSVERWIDWQISPDNNWEGYIKAATEYYKLNEKQVTAAQAILKDCQEQAKKIKTPQWRSQIIENRITQRLTQRNADMGDGPWMFSLEEEYRRLLKPIEELSRDFKRRIDSLPDSAQRAAARESVRRKLEDKGLKHVPS